MSRDLILVAISLFAWGLGESAFFSFQPLYLEQLGADPLLIGGVLGAYGIATTLVHIPAGYLADRFGRRPIMWSAWVLGIIATWFMAISSSLPGFIAGVVIYGLTMFVLAPLNSYITAARGKLSVGRAITFVSASFHTGAVIGPIMGGYLGDHYGFRSIFFIAGVIFIISTFIIFFIRPQPTEAIVKGENGNTLIANYRYLSFVAVFFLASFTMYLPQPLSPNYLQNQGGLSLIQIGQLYSISEVGIVIISLIFGQMDARKGFLFGQMAIALFSLFLWQGKGLPMYSLAYFLLGGYRAARSLATAHIRSLVESANMGLAYGLAETFAGLATVLAPILAGFFYSSEPSKMYSISITLVIITILISAFVTSPSRSLNKQGESLSI